MPLTLYTPPPHNHNPNLTLSRREVERRFHACRLCSLRCCLARLHARTRRVVLLRCCSARVVARAVSAAARRAFSEWKGRWARTLFWRSSEDRRAREGQLSLLELKTQTLRDLEEAVASLRRDVGEGQAEVHALQAALDDKEALLCDAAVSLEARAAERAALEKALVEARQQLGGLEQEREGLRRVERELLRQRERDAEALSAKREEAERLIRRLEVEGEALRAEALEAREQARLAEASAAEGIVREEARLTQARAALEAVEAEGRLKAGAVVNMGVQQRHLEAELRSVQDRLDAFLSDSRAMGEGDDQVRNS